MHAQEITPTSVHAPAGHPDKLKIFDFHDQGQERLDWAFIVTRSSKNDGCIGVDAAGKGTTF
jgi:hypothetical protein